MAGVGLVVDMHQVLYEALRRVAEAGTLVCYGEVASIAGVDLSTGRGRREMGRLLAEICTGEAEQARPMLGSVVVRKDTGVPGEGFFRGARKLGKFSGENNEEKRAFWVEELRRVHAQWSPNSPGASDTADGQ